MSEEVFSPAFSRTVVARLLRGCAWLAVAVFLAWIPVAWYGHRQHGADGILAAAAAAAVTLCGACAAYVLSGLVRGPQAAMIQLAGGMALRMGVPLLGAMTLSQSARLAESGVFGFVVIFYLVALAVETPLSLHFIDRPKANGLSVSCTREVG